MLLSFELVGAFLLMFIFMSVLWFIQRYKGEADIVDVGWAAGLGFIAIYYSLSLEGYWLRRVLLALLAATWSTRLASYLLLSRVLKPGEDGRYVSLRAKWGAKAQRNFFLFFQFQGLLVIIFSLPFFVVASHNALGLDIWDYIGLIIFLVSISGEWIADYQLANYKKNEANHGKTCRNGLWKYSRHPNYFFEWLHWWSYVALAVGSPYFWISLIGPTLMLFLILKVTGIPPTEKRALETKGEDYRNYQATTNAFFPWPPKKLT
jgi:steroid 5-alpha reductase family enzyme